MFAFSKIGAIVLTGCHFVVTGLDGDAAVVELAFDIEHERQNAFRDGTEVLIFKLSDPWEASRQTTCDRHSAGQECVKEVAVDEEISPAT